MQIIDGNYRPAMSMHIYVGNSQMQRLYSNYASTLGTNYIGDKDIGKIHECVVGCRGSYNRDRWYVSYPHPV